MLESFSSKFIDSFNGNIGLKTTPNLDYFAKNGLKFNNFYANGQRSIQGITAIFTGLINPNSNIYLGRGLEASGLTYLGNLAKQNGYSTISMQSSNRNSLRFDSISKLAGFDEYYGSEDFTKNTNGEDKDKKPLYGTWDGDMLGSYFDKINNIKKPFLSFAFTSTSHFPFVSAGKKWQIYPHIQKDTLGFLNTMKYTDDMLGVFIDRCKKQPWFKDTIFIFLADHTAGLHNISIKNIDIFAKNYNIKFPNRKNERFKIPLVIYAPYIFKPKVIDIVSSQADILPSLVDYLGWDSSFSTISNSFFDKMVENRFAISKFGDKYLIVTKEKLSKKQNKTILQSIRQSTYNLLLKNKLY
jgi:phosphoglycerol transferase MdoB-like AlkP superfamily enzyme